VLISEPYLNTAVTRVPTPPGKSGKVLDLFLKISGTWKVLENEIGPGN